MYCNINFKMAAAVRMKLWLHKRQCLVATVIGVHVVMVIVTIVMTIAVPMVEGYER